MSFELTDAIANSDYMLGHALPHFETGKLTELRNILGFATLYRRRGIARLLVQGIVNPLQVAQMQSVSAYLHALPKVPEDEKVTSLAACFWDAVGAQYWDAAAEIAKLSRTTYNPKREHEDDFIYVMFLMQRYFLAPPPDALAEEREAHEAEQQQRLERWEEVLEEGLDLRLDLCRALTESDAEAFADAIIGISEQRDEDLRERQTRDIFSKEDMAWRQPIWPEGLALLRLAERDDLVESGLVIPYVPPVLLTDNPYLYNAKAWQSADFQPRRRS